MVTAQRSPSVRILVVVAVVAMLAVACSSSGRRLDERGRREHDDHDPVPR